MLIQKHIAAEFKSEVDYLLQFTKVAVSVDCIKATSLKMQFNSNQGVLWRLVMGKVIFYDGKVTNCFKQVLKTANI